MLTQVRRRTRAPVIVLGCFVGVMLVGRLATLQGQCPVDGVFPCFPGFCIVTCTCDRSIATYVCYNDFGLPVCLYHAETDQLYGYDDPPPVGFYCPTNHICDIAFYSTCVSYCENGEC